MTNDFEHEARLYYKAKIFLGMEASEKLSLNRGFEVDRDVFVTESCVSEKSTKRDKDDEGILKVADEYANTTEQKKDEKIIQSKNKLKLPSNHQNVGIKKKPSKICSQTKHDNSNIFKDDIEDEVVCEVCKAIFKTFQELHTHLSEELNCQTSFPRDIEKKIHRNSGETWTKTYKQDLKIPSIPDPIAAHGLLKIPPDDQSEKPYWSIERQNSSLGRCQKSHQGPPGVSKIDHETSILLTTLPVNTFLSPLALQLEDCKYAESFVAMTLSKDGESVEVKYLLHRNDIRLEKFQDLLHHVLCVIESDLFSLLSDRGSPVLISPPEQLPLLRNRFTKEILAVGREKPPRSSPLCEGPFVTYEDNFISDAMLDDIPFNQLLLNTNLGMKDTGSVGVQFRRPSQEKIWLAPIFSVNSNQEWGNFTKLFFTILVNWTGSKSTLTDILHRLPCGITAKNQYFDLIKSDCYNLVMEPRDILICEHCGEQFESYKYLFSEKNKYKHHVESHKLQCKVCGEYFPNPTVRIFHERTHRKNHVSCTKEGCKWVGRSEKSLRTHIRIFHTQELCDLCGKEFANSQSLSLHVSSYHLPKKPNNWFCEVCGKGYSSKNILDKHVKRHFKENSLVNKWMNDSPNEYKYECTKHTNCKKYFKTEAQFKRHIKSFATRDYPIKCATQYRPDIDPSKRDFITTLTENGNPQASQVRKNIVFQMKEESIGKATKHDDGLSPNSKAI